MFLRRGFAAVKPPIFGPVVMRVSGVHTVAASLRCGDAGGAERSEVEPGGPQRSANWLGVM